MNQDPISWKIGLEPAELNHEDFWSRYDHFNMPDDRVPRGCVYHLKFDQSRSIWRD